MQNGPSSFTGIGYVVQSESAGFEAARDEVGKQTIMAGTMNIDSLICGCLMSAAWLLWRWPVARTCGQLRALEETPAAQPSLGVILEMMAVAMREGSSIPRALDVIGSIVSGRLGAGMCKASRSLMLGYSWKDAWLAASLACRSSGENDVAQASAVSGAGGENPQDIGSKVPSGDVAFALEALSIINDALTDSWTRGVSPVGPLESAVEQLDARARASIEQSAQRLSVRLLLPTGLCFLPAFMLIGIIPAIGSFVGH